MKALVIGGGIIGLSSAYYLKRNGFEVTVLDRTNLADSCSYGNLGMIVPSHFVPLAAPGMVAQGIRWMFNSRSPFYVKPSLSPSLISWGLKFIKSATARHLEEAALPLLNLNVYSKQLYEELAREPGFDFSLQSKGILMYYKTQKVGDEEVHLAEKAQRMGLDVEALSKAQVQQLEPDAELNILGAVHYRSDAHLSPHKLVPQFIEVLRASGVRINAEEPVEKMTTGAGSIQKVITPKNEYGADVVVLAGGSWLPQLAAMAGVKVPLMPGKGYSFNTNDPQHRLNIPAILCEARVAITPMNGSMRYGGTMEIAPVNDKINMNRVEGIVDSVPEYFSNIRLPMPKPADVWYGFRPCSPDGLPYIGFSKKVGNLLIAGGHSMMGLSLGPATGKIVADLAAGKKPEVAIEAFDANRFA